MAPEEGDYAAADAAELPDELEALPQQVKARSGGPPFRLWAPVERSRLIAQTFIGSTSLRPCFGHAVALIASSTRLVRYGRRMVIWPSNEEVHWARL